MAYKTYWFRQFSQIKEEGIEALWRKLKTVSRKFIMLILNFLVIPIVLILRVIKPFYWIRFGWLFGSRIGHFAFDVEYYLTERKLGLHPEKANDIFFLSLGKTCQCLFCKNDRTIFISVQLGRATIYCQ